MKSGDFRMNLNLEKEVMFIRNIIAAAAMVAGLGLIVGSAYADSLAVDENVAALGSQVNDAPYRFVGGEEPVDDYVHAIQAQTDDANDVAKLPGHILKTIETH